MATQHNNAARWGVLITTLIAGFTVVLNNSLLNVAMPFFMSYYDLTAVQAQWIVTMFAIGMLISMPTTGFLGYKFGYKKLFVSSVVLFLCASLFGASAWDFNIIIFARLLQGLSGGVIMPLALMLVFQYFNKSERGFVLGIWGVSVMVAPAIGPTIGGILLNFFNWPTLFLINVPTSMVCIVTALYLLEGKRIETEEHTFDWRGFVLISTGLISLLIGIEQVSHSSGLRGPLLFLGIGILLIWAFVRHQLKSDDPLLNLRIFKNKIYTASLVISTFSTLAMFGVLLLIPIFIQEVNGDTPLIAGLALFPNAMAVGISMIVGGKILDHKGPFIPFISGALLIFVFAITVSVTIDHNPLWLTVTLLACYGVGNGFINTPAVATAVNALRDHNVKDGSAIINMFKQMAKVSSIVFLSMLFELRRGYHMTQGEEIYVAGMLAIKESFLFVGCVAIVMIPIIFYISKRYAR